MTESRIDEYQLLSRHFEASLLILNDYVGEGISFERASLGVEQKTQIIPEGGTVLIVKTNSGDVLMYLAENTSKLIASSMIGADYSDLRNRDLDMLEMSALKDSISIVFSKFIEDSNLKEHFRDFTIKVDESCHRSIDGSCVELNFNCFANQIECGFIRIFIPENKNYSINPIVDSTEEHDSKVISKQLIQGFKSHWFSFETYKDRGYEYKLHALKEYIVSLAILARNEGLYAIEEYLETGPWDICKYYFDYFMRVYAIDSLEAVENRFIDAHGRKIRRHLLSEFEYIAPLLISLDLDLEDSIRVKDPKSVDYLEFAHCVNQQQSLSKENIEEIVRFEMTFLQSVILGVRHIFNGTSHEVIEFHLSTLLSEFVLD